MEGWHVDRWVEQSLAYPSDEFFPEMWTWVPGAIRRMPNQEAEALSSL